jgi:dTDP-glucose 4,6-dehydratase
MRILITGGAGFIGSHLCDRLLADGHIVIAMDNLSTGSVDNIAHLAGHERFSFVKHDVTNYIFIEGPLDAVLHLASLPSPVDYLNFPIQTLKVGALGTHKTLGLVKEKGVNPIGPRGVYDESKRFAESLTMAYHRYHGVDTRIVRIFNTYGERMRMDDGRVVPNFVCQALRGQPLTVYDGGKRTRSFCYVSDLVEGMVRLLESDEHEPVNMGNPHEMTILQFAYKVLKVVGGDSEITFIRPTDERTADDPKTRQPDISKAKQILGWEPVVPLEEGLARTADYFRRRLGL